MTTGLTFELVAPERLLVSRPVGMVTVPGTEGDFGVLPGHAPLVSSLRAGVVTVHDEGKLSARYFVAGGFAEVSSERCTVLAEEAVPVEELNRATLEVEAANLRGELAGAEATHNASLRAALALIEAKLLAAA